MASSITYTIPSGSTAVIDFPSVSVAHAPIISAQGHFTSIIRYNIQVRGYVTVASGGQSLANKIVDYRNILSTPGGNLSISIGDYAKTFLAAEASNLGPHPTAFEVLEMPGGKIAKVTWQLAIEVLGNRKVTGENWWTEFAYTIESSVNVNLLITRVISGILRINPRDAKLNQGLTHASADACRKAVEANVCTCPDPAYWERQWTFKLSEDETQLWFTCVDQERFMPLPKNVTSGDFSIVTNFDWENYGAIVSLQCSYFGQDALIACTAIEQKLGEFLVAQSGDYGSPGAQYAWLTEHVRSQYNQSERSFRSDSRAEWRLSFWAKPSKKAGTKASEMKDVLAGWMRNHFHSQNRFVSKVVDFFDSMRGYLEEEKKKETWKTGDRALTGVGEIVGRCGSEELLQQLLITIPDKLPPWKKPPGDKDEGGAGNKPLDTPGEEEEEPIFYLSWHEHFAYKIDWGYKFIPTIGGVDVTQQWHKPTVWLITTGEMTTMEIMPRPKPPAYQYGSAERKDKTVTKAYLVNAEFALNEPTRDGHWNSSWRYIVKLEVDSIPKNWEVLFPDSPFFEFEEPPVFALPELTNETQE